MQLKDFDNDSDAVVHWQKSRDPMLLSELLLRFKPAIISSSNKYGTTGMSPFALRANATDHAIKALSSYDPSHGTSPNTHIMYALQSVQRGARESLMSGSIPEYRHGKMATYMTVRQNMIDQYGRDPTHDEMADELSWSPREVARMEKELGGEVGASKAESDFFGHSTTMEHQDRTLAELLYPTLAPKEKTIMEHTFGIGGKPILNNKEIAHKLGTYEMDITRTKRKLAAKIAEHRR